MNEHIIRANNKQIYILPDWQDKGDSDFDWFIIEDRGDSVLATAYPKDPNAMRLTFPPTMNINKKFLVLGALL